jgi:hypothetical protein
MIALQFRVYSGMTGRSPPGGFTALQAHARVAISTVPVGATIMPGSNPHTSYNAGRKKGGHITKLPPQNVPLSSSALQFRLQHEWTVSRAVYSCIAALEVNVLKCRGQGRAPRVWRETSAMLSSFGSRELCQPNPQVDGKPDTESNLSSSRRAEPY